MPGNPLETDYGVDELNKIGRVIAQSKVRVIVDAAFTGIHIKHRPLAAVMVKDNLGNEHDLYDQTITITGISKGHHACGPYKIGAATSGNSDWLAEVRKNLTVTFQRETTLLAKAVIENTPLSYLEQNEQDMIRSQREAKAYFHELDELFGENAIRYFGKTTYGPFLLISFREDILAQAEIEDGWQLADMLMAAAGINCVAGCLMGITDPVVRININAPRTGSTKNPKLLTLLFERLTQLLSKIVFEDLTYPDALAKIDVLESVSIAPKPIEQNFQPV